MSELEKLDNFYSFGDPQSKPVDNTYLWSDLYLQLALFGRLSLLGWTDTFSFRWRLSCLLRTRLVFHFNFFNFDGSLRHGLGCNLRFGLFSHRWRGRSRLLTGWLILLCTRLEECSERILALSRRSFARVFLDLGWSLALFKVRVEDPIGLNPILRFGGSLTRLSLCELARRECFSRHASHFLA